MVFGAAVCGEIALGVGDGAKEEENVAIGSLRLGEPRLECVLQSIQKDFLAMVAQMERV